MPRFIKFTLIGLILIAAALRVKGLFLADLNPDEALFGTWARLIATWKDPLLKTQLVDKPPLSFYLQAISYPFIGPYPTASRIPGFIASILIIPLTPLVVWRLYRDIRSVLLSAGFIAVSPLGVQYGSSAFLDPLMSVLIIASLAITVNLEIRFRSADPETRETVTGQAADSNRTRHSPNSIGRAPFTAGLLFGLASAVKYQAWLFLPLLIVFGLLRGWKGKQWIQWSLGALPLILAFFLWDLVQDNRLGLLSAQWHSIGGIRVIRSWELWSRLESWRGPWIYLAGSAVTASILILGSAFLVYRNPNDGDERTLYDQTFGLFLLFYAVLHWFLAVPVWDRYILAILPVAGIIFARVVSRLFDRYSHLTLSRFRGGQNLVNPAISLLCAIFLTFQAANVWAAREGNLPPTSPGASSRDLAWICSQISGFPDGTVLYDHWYSWQLRYYLFDDQIFVSWFPDVESLTKDVRVFGAAGSPRLIILPANETAEPVKRAIGAAGFVLVEASNDKNLMDRDSILYQIVLEG